MAEYIERDKVYEILNSLLNDICDSTETSEEFDVGWETALERANDKINDIFAADVRPERHGRWIEKRGYNIPLDMYDVSYNCSCCGNTVYKKYVFCPHCGAKMDGKDV